MQKLSLRSDVSGLIRARQHSSAEIRREAIVALGAIASPAAISGVIGALQDCDESVRASAHKVLVDLLRGSGGHRWLGQFKEALHHRSPEVRSAAIGVLADSGLPVAADLLKDRLFDSHAAVTAAAEGAFQRFGDVAIPVLESLLVQEKLSDKKRDAVFRALAKIPGEKLLPAMRRIAANDHVSPDLRHSAGTIIVAASGTPAEILRTQAEPLSVRLAAVSQLAPAGDPAVVAALVQIIATHSEDARVRHECVRHLPRHAAPHSAAGSEAVKALHEVIKEPQPDPSSPIRDQLRDLKIQAVCALASYRGAAVLSALATALGDPAVEAHVTEYRPKFHGDEDLDITTWVHPVREAAAEALRGIGSREALALLEANAPALQRTKETRHYD